MALEIDFSFFPNVSLWEAKEFQSTQKPYDVCTKFDQNWLTDFRDLLL